MLPLSPTGTFPSPGNKPEEERSEHDAPDWRLALPPRGVRDPLWTPGPNDADERVRSRALQEVRVLTLIHDRVAVIDPKSARPASMRDRRKVHELLMERSLAEVETILNWVYDNPRWISWLVDGTMVERYFAQVSLDMRTKQAQGPQRSGSHTRLTRANGRHTGHENDANDDAAGCDGGPDEDGSEPDFAQLVTTINPKEPPMN